METLTTTVDDDKRHLKAIFSQPPWSLSLSHVYPPPRRAHVLSHSQPRKTRSPVFCESLQIIVWFETRVSRVQGAKLQGLARPRLTHHQLASEQRSLNFSSFSSLFVLWLHSCLMGFLFAIKGLEVISHVEIDYREYYSVLEDYRDSALRARICFSPGNTCNRNAPVKP